MIKMEKFHLSKLCLIIVGAFLFAQNVIAGNWNQVGEKVKTAETGADMHLAMMQRLAIAKTQTCNSEVSRFIPLPHPKTHLDLKSEYKKVFKSSEQYAASLHQLAVNYFFNNEPASEKQAVDLMLNWAKSNSHKTVSSPFKSKSTSRYPTYMVIGSSLTALLLLDQSAYLTGEKRKKIWSWLDNLVEESYITRELPTGSAGYRDEEQRVNNHNLRRAVILLLYGIHKKDETFITMSKERFYRSYESIKGDVLYDSNRGDWALNYINLGILGFVEYLGFIQLIDETFVEPAMLRKVNSAAQFLIDETIEPLRIHSFAKQNIGRPSAKYSGLQRTWWQKKYTGGLTHYAWVDAPFVTVNFKSLRPLIKAPTPRYSEVAGYIDCLF